MKTAPQICRSPTEFWVNIRNLLTFSTVILSARAGNYIKIRKIKLQPVPWGITISMSKAYRLAGAVAAPLLTAGCGMPIGVQIASFLADTVSVITTDKTLTDHGISSITKKDCALWRTIEGKNICRESDNSVTTLADASSMPRAVSTKVKLPEPNRGATATVKTINKNFAWRETAEFPKEEPGKAVAALPPLTAPAPEVIPTKTNLTPWAPITTEVIVPETLTRSKNIIVTPAAPTIPTRHNKPTYVVPKTVLTPPTNIQPMVKPTTVAEPVYKPAAPVQPASHKTRQTFFIIASYHHKAAASRFSGKHSRLEPTILEGTAHGKRVYRIAIGPVLREDRKQPEDS